MIDQWASAQNACVIDEGARRLAEGVERGAHCSRVADIRFQGHCRAQFPSHLRCGFGVDVQHADPIAGLVGVAGHAASEAVGGPGDQHRFHVEEPLSSRLRRRMRLP